jgi:hypothetical protein
MIKFGIEVHSLAEANTKEGVYMLTDDVKCYIGSTFHLRARMALHYATLQEYTCDNRLYRYWREHELHLYIINPTCSRNLEEDIIRSLDTSVLLNSRVYKRNKMIDVRRSVRYGSEASIQTRRSSNRAFRWRHKAENYLHRITI